MVSKGCDCDLWLWLGRKHFSCLANIPGISEIIPISICRKKSYFTAFIEMKEQRDRQTAHRAVVRALT